MYTERTYRGKTSKYNRIISDINENDKLFIMATSWGDPKAAELAVNTVKDYYLSAKTDQEFTSPYPLSKELSLSGNHLRIGTMLANERVYKDFNSEEYTAGVELMAVCIRDRELNIAHIGGPNFLLMKRGKEVIPCIPNQHMGFEFAASKNYPLPKNLLGVHLKKYVQSESYRINKDDGLVFVYADFCPALDPKDNEEEIEKKLQLYSERPYWIGLWRPFT